MKYFSDKCGPKLMPDLNEEFSGDFFEIENAYAQTELAGGPISKRIVESRADLSHLKSTPL